MIHLNFYTKQNCPLCDEALTLVDLLKNDYLCTVEERDIYSKDEWLEKYHLSIPVIEINGKELNCEQITYDSIEALLKESSKNK